MRGPSNLRPGTPETPSKPVGRSRDRQWGLRSIFLHSLAAARKGSPKLPRSNLRSNA
jgi:hypothetical protein